MVDDWRKRPTPIPSRVWATVGADEDGFLTVSTDECSVTDPLCDEPFYHGFNLWVLQMALSLSEQRVKELEADYRALEECQERNDASATDIIAEQSSHIVELITVIDNALYTLESNPTPHISRMESAKLILRQAKGHQGRRRNEQI